MVILYQVFTNTRAVIPYSIKKGMYSFEWMQIRTIDSFDPLNSLARQISFLDKAEGKKYTQGEFWNNCVKLKLILEWSLSAKLQDICSFERQKDKISLKSHVSNWQPLKSTAPENRFYFIDHKSKRCVLPFYYLGGKILWDCKFLSFPVCKYTIFNGLVLYLKAVLSTYLVAPRHCIIKYSYLCFQDWELGER